METLYTYKSGLIQTLQRFNLYLLVFFIPITTVVSLTAAVLMLIFWVIEGNLRKKLEYIKNKKTLWLLIIIGLLTILSAFFSNSTSDGFLSSNSRSIYTSIMSHYILIPFVAIVIATSFNKKELEKALSLFILSVFICEVLSYSISFHLVDISFLKSHHLLGKYAQYSDPSPFMSHIAYGIFLAITAIFTLDKITKSNKGYWLFFYILFFISININIVITGGRSGQAAYILALFVYIFTFYRLTVRSFLVTTMAVSLMIFSAYSFSPIFKNRVNAAINNIEQTQEGNYYSSVGMRTASYMVTLNYLTSTPVHFILGAGAGDSHKEYLNEARNKFSKNIQKSIAHLSHIHNQYLQFWMDGTIISLVIFLMFLYSLYKLPIDNNKALLKAIVTIIAFVSLTNNQMYRYPTALLFMFLTAYFVTLEQHIHRK